MFAILFKGRQIYLIPFGLQARLLNSRSPVKEFALLTRSHLYRFCIHYLLINNHIVELNGQFLGCIEADICSFASDDSSHIVNHLFGHYCASRYDKFFIDCALDWVSKRDLLGKSCIFVGIIGNDKLRFHTAWSAEGGH